MKIRSLFVVPLLALMGCQSGDGQLLEYSIAATFPHDTGAYTQGLLFHEGFLYESTGRYGESTLRKVNPQTGEVVMQVALDSALFGEGLARVENRLIQLTWKAGRALVYDLETFDLVDEFAYEGDGWGLCYDGTSLFMSNGGSVLTRRDPNTFEVLEEIPVLAGGISVNLLNELECVGEHVWANVYQDDRVVRIDKVTGTVTGEIDGAGLNVAGQRPAGRDPVLNGIAYIAETDTFLMTGKLWPRTLGVKLEG